MDLQITLATYPGLDERITIVRAGYEVDAVFVRTQRFNVLVDTLSTPALCRQALALLTPQMADRPLLVVNSHMDWDHFWGNAAFDRHQPVIAHATALACVNSLTARQTLQEKMREMRFQDVEIIAPSIVFSGPTMMIDGGDLSLELIHTPGHTPDHLAVWIPDVSTCLAVDAAEAPIPEVWSSDPADLVALCASLKRIKALDACHLVLAHGQSAAPAVVDQNLAYFAAVRDRIASLAAEGEINPTRELGTGLQLEDFVTLPADMPTETRAFYDRCHRSNLSAAIEARKSRIDFLQEVSHG